MLEKPKNARDSAQVTFDETERDVCMLAQCVWTEITLTLNSGCSQREREIERTDIQMKEDAGRKIKWSTVKQFCAVHDTLQCDIHWGRGEKKKERRRGRTDASG